MKAETGPKRVSPSTVPKELLERYSTSGPRYTSYPTAPHFETGFDRERIVSEWKRTNDENGGALSLYIHIPFCKTLCLYCGCFTRFGRSEEAVDSYIDAVLRESGSILEIISRDRHVEQLALGGGTPTYLSMKQMTRLMEDLGSWFTFSSNGEYSIEIDPLTVDDTYLDLLVDLGFNRFSFGVQDLDPVVQKNVHRVLPLETLDRIFDHLRRRGHNAINIDLIYGLPGQTAGSFGETIRKVIDLGPSRIALFGYAHVPWVSPHQKALEKYHIPDTEERMDIFGRAFDQLLDSGYAHVGMDHFAMPEDELIRALGRRTLTRNFMGYTTRRGLDLVGLGASAISSVGTTYTQNTKDIDGYSALDGRSPWIKGLLLTREDEMRRELILDLFCNFYLDMNAFEEKHGIDFRAHFAEEMESLEPMRDDGLVAIDGNALTVTDLGRFFIRNICMTFDQYLGRGDRDVRYSRTI